MVDADAALRAAARAIEALSARWRSLRQDARKAAVTLGPCKECQVVFFVEFFVPLAGILCRLPRTGEVLTWGVMSVAQRTPTGAKNAR
jgi:hypothetical protein